MNSKKSIAGLSKAPSFSYDWDSIASEDQRLIAKSCVEGYAKQHRELQRQAAKLVRQDTSNKALCVYHLKTHLDHGLFLSVCEQALGIKKDSAAALAAIGKEIHEGKLQGDVLEMVKKMEPRAVRRLLKVEPETKSRYVAMYAQDGFVPSQRTFQQSSPKPKEKPQLSTLAELEMIYKALENIALHKRVAVKDDADAIQVVQRMSNLIHNFFKVDPIPLKRF